MNVSVTEVNISRWIFTEVTDFTKTDGIITLVYAIQRFRNNIASINIHKYVNTFYGVMACNVIKRSNVKNKENN